MSSTTEEMISILDRLTIQYKDEYKSKCDKDRKKGWNEITECHFIIGKREAILDAKEMVIEKEWSARMFDRK